LADDDRGAAPGDVLEAWLEATAASVEPGDKGWPPEAWGLDAGEIRRLGLRVADLPTPVVTLDRDALRHNVRVMARYCLDHGVSLAPHAKTSMAPAIVKLQLEAGAWAMTAATWLQARMLHAAGCRRVLVANQLLDPIGLRWAAEAGLDGQAEVLCYVDSTDGIELMCRALDALPGGARIGVLVELGVPGGRTGARTVAAAAEVARAAARSPRLRLRGVAAYEAVGVTDRSAPALARVRAFLRDVRTLADVLLDDGTLGVDGFVTAGGSLLFDEVVAALAPLRSRLRVVLRSGCYASHDSGFYELHSPLGGGRLPGGFRPALALRSLVLSRPEPGRAVADFGKRDTSVDMGPPVVRRVRRAGVPVPRHRPGVRVVELYDQHALLAVDPGDPLAPGDVLECGVSHPCTTFDRWRALPVVEGGDRVIDVARTYF
jgi:D-serine deaminase-like pyridoxal phosphate-dependent protein